MKAAAMNGEKEPVGGDPTSPTTVVGVGDLFEGRWRAEQTLDDLAGYLPPDNDPAYLEVLVELVCRDLERRLQVGQPARAEQYLERFPALALNAATAIEVILTEFHQRRWREEDLDPEEYRRRFPQFAAALTEQMHRGRPVLPGYEILGRVGHGGMGAVYKARQLALNRVVALKVILAGEHIEPAMLARFRGEAEAAAALQHPNIVQIFEVGEYGGLPFLVLEYVAGGTLAEKLHGTPWEARRAAALVETLARALHHAHQAGIVHRDLKPGNVLLAADGSPKIADFGLAKHLGREQSLTETGAIVGTVSYMAPEQARGKNRVTPITPLTDVYALGATLYEMLTGRPPFQGLDPVDTLVQVVHQEPVPPGRLQPRVPRDLETICLKCLEKEPARRYATAQALAEDLQRFLRGEPILARPVGPVNRLWRWSRRNRLVAGLIAAVAATLVLGTAVAVWLAIRANANAERADWNAGEARESEARARQEQQKAEKELLRAEGLLYAEQIALALHSWEEGDVTAAWQYLDATRKDFRGWEHDYLHNLFNNHQQTFRGHTLQVYTVTFGPDGKRLISGGDNEGIVWDVATGRKLHILKAPPGEGFDGIFRVAVSPDGERILSSGFTEGTMRLWDMASGKVRRTMRARGGGVWSTAFLADGKRFLSATQDGTMQLWNAGTGDELRSFQHKEPFACAAFTADGKQLVCGSGKRVKVLDTANGEEIQTLQGHEAPVLSVAVSADGQAIVSGDLVTVKMWNAMTGKELHTFTGPHTKVSTVAMRADGKVIAWGSPNEVLLGALGQPERSAEWLISRFERNWFSSGTFELIAGGHMLKGHKGEVTRVAFSPDGKRVASASRDGTVKLWDTMPHLQAKSLQPWARVETVAFSPDATRIVTTRGYGPGGDQVKVWDVATAREERTLPKHPDTAVSVAVSPDGQWIVSGSRDGTIKMWAAATGREQLSLKAGSLGVVAIDADGKRIASGSSDPWGVKVWDTANRNATHMMGSTGAWSLAFSPDGQRLAAGCADNSIKVWDTATGQEVLNLQGHTSLVRFLAFRSDGQQLLSGSLDGTVKVWQVSSGKELLSCKGDTGGITNAAFTPDRERIVSGSDKGIVKFWDARTGQETLALQGPAGSPDINTGLHPVWVSVCPDGKRIVAVGSHGRAAVTIWDATRRQDR
jgi:WD40 repeat protein